MAPAGRPANPVPSKLLDKLKSQYQSIDDFVKVTKIPLAKETVRRVVYNNKRTSAPVMIIIWKYLGYSSDEIKAMLIEAGEEDFSSLIGKSIPMILETWKWEILKLVEPLRKDAKAYKHVIEYLKNMVRLAASKNE